MGNRCFIWLSLWCLLWRLLCCPFFPLDVLDGIWDLIESVSEGFLTYSCKTLTSLPLNELAKLNML